MDLGVVLATPPLDNSFWYFGDARILSYRLVVREWAGEAPAMAAGLPTDARRGCKSPDPWACTVPPCE